MVMWVLLFLYEPIHGCGRRPPWQIVQIRYVMCFRCIVLQITKYMLQRFFDGEHLLLLTLRWTCINTNWHCRTSLCRLLPYIYLYCQADTRINNFISISWKILPMFIFVMYLRHAFNLRYGRAIVRPVHKKCVCVCDSFVCSYFQLDG
jgi:hypothetical protein